MKLKKIRQAVAIDPQRKMSFDAAWASHFSDPAWVAIELYSRVNKRVGSFEKCQLVKFKNRLN